jgi:hypothetical protein
VPFLRSDEINEERPRRSVAVRGRRPFLRLFRRFVHSAPSRRPVELGTRRRFGPGGASTGVRIRHGRRRDALHLWPQPGRTRGVVFRWGPDVTRHTDEKGDCSGRPPGLMWPGKRVPAEVRVLPVSKHVRRLEWVTLEMPSRRSIGSLSEAVPAWAVPTYQARRQPGRTTFSAVHDGRICAGSLSIRTTAGCRR